MRGSLVVIFCALLLKSSISLAEAPQRNAIRAAILKEFVGNKVSWDYDWTTAIFLYAAIRTQQETDPDWMGVLELVWRERPEAATMPDLAAMSLAPLSFQDRKNQTAETSKNVVAFSKAYFESEPLNSGGVFDHVGKRHRFAWYWPPTHWLMPSSVWADSAVMYGLNGFLLARHDRDSEREKFFLEQVERIHKYLVDPATGLYWHAYFFTLDLKAPRWARGNLWMSLASIDILEKLQSTDPFRASLSQKFSTQMKALARLVDRENGLRTLLDEPEAPFETTASSLFAYAAMKGARLGLLDPSFAEIGHSLAKGLLKKVEWKSQTNALVRGISCPTTAVPVKFYYTSLVGECPNESYGVGAYLLMLSELSFAEGE